MPHPCYSPKDSQPFLSSSISLIHEERKLSVHRNKGVQQPAEAEAQGYAQDLFWIEADLGLHLLTWNILHLTLSSQEEITFNLSIKQYYKKMGLHSAGEFLTHLQKEISKLKLPQRIIFLACWCYVSVKPSLLKPWNQLHTAWTLSVWSMSWLTWAISG